MARAGRLICAGAAVALGFVACGDDDSSTGPTGAGAHGPIGCDQAVVLEDPGTITGSTLGATNLDEGSCITGAAPDVRFKVTPAETGMLDLTLAVDGGEDLGLYVRTACDDDQTEIACADRVTGGEDESLTIPVNAGESVWVIVDGYSADHAGSFTLTAASRPVACGDSRVEAGEQCDPPAEGVCTEYCKRLPEICNDGIDNDIDGRSDCEDLGDCGGDATNCPFATVCGDAGVAEAEVNGDSSSGGRYFVGSCTGGELSPEVLLTYDPPISGALMLTLQSATDQGLYVRASCADPDTEIRCLDEEPGGRDELLIFPVQINVPVSIFIDAADPAQAGPFKLLTALEPSTETESNDTPGGANNNLPQGIVGAIHPAGDVDFIKINVPAPGSTLTAEIQDLGNDDCAKNKIDTVVEIYGPDGATSLAANDDHQNTLCSRAEATDLAAGQYFVRVAASENALLPTFAYRLVLQVN